jgi:molybdate transport system substrate-binding protein
LKISSKTLFASHQATKKICDLANMFNRINSSYLCDTGSKNPDQTVYTVNFRIIGILFISIMISCQEPESPSLVIASAANVQFAMDEIVTKFTEKTGVSCDVIISSSGKLTAQLIEGAPFDVFISADLAYPQKIADAGLAVRGPQVYARGKLVLWSMQDITKLTLGTLAQSSTRYIALANPDVAPYGRAAKEVLQFADLYEDVQEKLVYGESIAQVNQFVISRAVDAGFTAKSVVLSPELKGLGTWVDIDPRSYKPIDQGFIILSNSHLPREAKSFEEFLLSEQAARIFDDYGYESRYSRN